MSIFGKLFRGGAAAAFAAIGTGTALAQEPAAPALLDLPGFSSQEQVSPASGFGRRGVHSAPSYPSPYYPCTPATPCPVTGEPMTPGTGTPTQPPTQPISQPDPLAPDFGNFGGGADVGPTVGLNGYIETAAPVTMARLRFDSGYGNNRPDRGNIFYPKCGCFRPAPDAIGPPLPAQNVDYQELTASAQLAITDRFAAFFDIPVRFINPESNVNAAGIGDISFGGKYAVVYNQCRIVSMLLRFQAPAGSPSLGLGNGNWWVEPGILYQEQLSDKWQAFSEFRFMTPLGSRTDFVGSVFRYGVGTSYVVAQGQWGYVAPVVEAVGWTLVSGKALNPNSGQAVSAAGDTIVNAKFGLRVGIGAPSLGSPFPTRSDLYIGYGRALTGEVWYKDMLRLEFRRFF